MSIILKKVCLLGEFAVGKTSLVRRFVEGIFEDKYLSTIGVKISRKELTLWSGAQPVNMTFTIWDIAGSEKFDQIMRSYYQGAGGGILVCDLTRPNTAEVLLNYARDFRRINPGAPLVVVGNKVDLINERAVSDETLAAAAEIQTPRFLSSAKTGENVEMIFQTLAEDILAASE